jgi:hypothetical protein
MACESIKLIDKNGNEQDLGDYGVYIAGESGGLRTESFLTS